MNDTSPPTIIAFASPKGGSGKSTSCLSIAGALLYKGHTVHIVDCDQSETLWRWHSDHSPTKPHPGLTVQKLPKENLAAFVESIWNHPTDYVLIDLAGQLTREMLHLAVFATLTITPVKISEPDIVEAQKIHEKLKEIQSKVKKPIIHRLLVNDVHPFRSNFEYALLDQMQEAELPRFKTMIYHRASYGESFMSGFPPHQAARSRHTVSKAVEEVDDLVLEIEALTKEAITLSDNQEKEAA